DAIAEHRLLDDLRGVRVLADEDVAVLVEQGDAAAEAAEGLRHLAADRPAADDREAPRRFGQLEDRLVGQVASLGEPGDRRRDRPAAGRDHGAPEPEPLAADLDGIRTDELAVAQEDVDAEPGEPRHAVVLGDPRPQPPHPGHGEPEVALPGGDGPAEALAALARGGPRAGGADHALGRHAADVQAISTHQVALDESDLRAETRGARGRDEARRSGADDHEVIARLRRRVDPGGGMDGVEELAVVLVLGFDQGAPLGVLHDQAFRPSSGRSSSWRSALLARRVMKVVTATVAAMPTPSVIQCAAPLPPAWPLATSARLPAAAP